MQSKCFDIYMLKLIYRWAIIISTHRTKCHSIYSHRAVVFTITGQTFLMNWSQFETLEKLSAHLIYLSQNVTAYAEYFWWKSFYRVEKTNPACNLCKSLNNIKTNLSSQNLQSTSEKYENFNDYWWTGKCRNLKGKFFRRRPIG